MIRSRSRSFVDIEERRDEARNCFPALWIPLYKHFYCQMRDLFAFDEQPVLKSSSFIRRSVDPSIKTFRSISSKAQVSSFKTTVIDNQHYPSQNIQQAVIPHSTTMSSNEENQGYESEELISNLSQPPDVTEQTKTELPMSSPPIVSLQWEDIENDSVVDTTPVQRVIKQCNTVSTLSFDTLFDSDVMKLS
ncbi:hypothetical protein RCL1_000323 [Eukaryota sp. TZLM3-RCL]